MMHRVSVVLGVGVVVAALAAAAADDPPLGLLVASVDDTVVVCNSAAEQLASFDTGPVGWLYPAPGGVLFAPDVVHGVTTVIDLRSLTVVETLDGVTTPIFGPFVDRYLVVTGREVIAVSYPERARIYSFPLAVASPWQAVVVGGGSSLIVLDRQPDGDGGSRLVAADLLSRKAVYAQPLPVDASRMAMMPEFGVLAMATPDAGAVRWVEPRARQSLLEVVTEGLPRDLAVAGDGRTTVVAVDGGEGGHHLELMTLRMKKHKGLVVKKRERAPLASAPVAVAVDHTGRYAAVATADARLLVVDCESLLVIGGGELPGVPRHLLWWIATAGPLLPTWSDASDEPVQLPEPLIH